MKALVYNGPFDVSVNEVPDTTIEKATDVLVEITSTNICGSDLHMYEGRTTMEPGIHRTLLHLTAEINGCCCLYLDCFDSDLLCFVRRLLVACLAPLGWQSITSTVRSPYPFKPLGTVRLRTYSLNDLEKSFLHRQGDKTI